MKSSPKSNDRVNARCHNCGDIKDHVFSELIRLVNRQARHIDYYHCSKCFRQLGSYKEECRKSSKASLSGRTSEFSKRSKEALARPEVRLKIIAHAKRLSTDIDFKRKVSDKIKNKFQTDKEYVERVNKGRSNKPAEFIARCEEIHDGFYDYSMTVYVGSNIPFTVRCPLHGNFTQLPSNHLQGHGCPECAKERSRLSSEEFFHRCTVIHNNKYDYRISEYKKSQEYIEYICPHHGVIKQLAQNHLKGSGCRFCDAAKTSSKGENELAEFVKSIGHCDRNDRSRLNGEEIDILTGNIGIEFHGMYWHSFNRLETTRERYRHYRKADLAIQEGLQLIQVYEEEWLNKRSIIESILRAKLGAITDKIYARDCKLKSISEYEAEVFFSYNHLQGHRRSEAYYALESKGEIIAAASFSRLKDKWELIRFCNSLNMIAIGGLSRILKNTNLGRIFTYADRRFSVANSYLSVGFKPLGVTAPGYRYCRGLKTYPRQMFQKHKLSSLLADFDPSKTEAENMFANGYRRIWDAGHWRLELS